MNVQTQHCVQNGEFAKKKKIPVYEDLPERLCDEIYRREVALCMVLELCLGSLSSAIAKGVANCSCKVQGSFQAGSSRPNTCASVCNGRRADFMS